MLETVADLGSCKNARRKSLPGRACSSSVLSSSDAFCFTNPSILRTCFLYSSSLSCITMSGVALLVCSGTLASPLSGILLLVAGRPCLASSPGEASTCRITGGSLGSAWPWFPCLEDLGFYVGHGWILAPLLRCWWFQFLQARPACAGLCAACWLPLACAVMHLAVV